MKQKPAYKSLIVVIYGGNILRHLVVQRRNLKISLRSPKNSQEALYAALSYLKSGKLVKNFFAKDSISKARKEAEAVFCEECPPIEI